MFNSLSVCLCVCSAADCDKILYVQCRKHKLDKRHSAGLPYFYIFFAPLPPIDTI